MVISNFLKTAEKFEIQAYKRPKNHKELRKTHVAFSGSPQKHPFDSYRVILVTDPYSTNTMYYEFMKKDISYVEELPNLGQEAQYCCTQFGIHCRRHHGIMTWHGTTGRCKAGGSD